MNEEIDEKALEVKRLFEGFLDDNHFGASDIKDAISRSVMKPEFVNMFNYVLIGITHCVYGEIRKADSDLLDIESILFLGD